MKRHVTLTAIGLVLALGAASCAQPGDMAATNDVAIAVQDAAPMADVAARIDNFRLVSADGYARELYRLKESQVAAMLVKRDTSDTDRAMAIQRVAAFGGEVSKLIESLPEECGCLVLTRGAVLGSGAQLIDLTPDVRRRLGL